MHVGEIARPWECDFELTNNKLIKNKHFEMSVEAKFGKMCFLDL